MRARTGKYTILWLLLPACGEIATFPSDVEPPQSIVKPAGPASPEECVHGGQIFDRGTDTNGNGELDSDEVQGQETLCNEFESLFQTRSEAPGPNCSNGGTALETGFDLNASNDLEQEEITSTTYFCNAPINAQVLLRVDPEPIGNNCSEGGIALHTGPDTDANGFLSSDEVESTSYVCNGGSNGTVNTEGGFFEGDYFVRNADDLTALESLAGITGTLKIEGDIDSVILPNLEFIGLGLNTSGSSLSSLELANLSSVGSITLFNNPALTHVSFPTLDRVVGDVLVDGEASLANLEFPTLSTAGDITIRGNASLQNVSAPMLRTSGNIFIAINPLMQTLTLSSLTTIEGSFRADRNESLTHLGELTELQTITGSLRVENNSQLATLGSFNSLEFIGTDLNILSNRSLTSLGVMPALLEVGGNLFVKHNLLLADLGSMFALQTVGGALELSDNNTATLDALASLISVGAALSITKFDAITSLGDLRALQFVGGDININDNESLIDLGSLTGLTHVHGLLRINSNPNLKSLAGLNEIRIVNDGLFVNFNSSLTSLNELTGITSVRKLFISSNNSLADLGLDGLVKLTATLDVKNHALLPQCEADNLLAQLQAAGNDPIDVVFSGNNGSGTCP